MDFHVAFGFLQDGHRVCITQIWMLGSLWFPELLLEFTPHVQEIGRSLKYVIDDSVVPDDADRTIADRMVLSPSLVKDPPLYISLPTIHGGEIFMGTPLSSAGKDVWRVSTCPRVTSTHKEQASVHEDQTMLQPGVVDTGEGSKRRTEGEKARRREAKKRRRKAQRTEAPNTDAKMLFLFFNSSTCTPRR